MDGNDKATATREAQTGGQRSRRLMLVPLAIFLAVAALFALALRKGDPSKLPSALIGKPAPEMTLPSLAGLREAGAPVPGFSTADLRRGTPTVVNFFASWCVPCVQEHPFLIELKERIGARIVGINYKDPDPGGRRFLGRYGNPYAAVGIDDSGRAAIEWGVYGMPETFVVDGRGIVTMKHVGPITRQVIEQRIIPAIEAARR
jgi:cytochrome c biogenesis protein CcmG/thiol:disulfide interchange protein DsbE